MMQTVSIPTNLAEISQGRDHITTDETARATNYKAQSIRKEFSQTGAFKGIRPIKIGNKLLWPVEPVAKLLSEGAE